jgi:hypothetical protein
MRADRPGAIPDLEGIGKRRQTMGPAMNATAEVLSQHLGAWIAIGIGGLGGTIRLALVVGGLIRFTRRLRDRRWDAQVSRAFAEAVASGDPQAADLMAGMALAADVRHAGAHSRAMNLSHANAVGSGWAQAEPRRRFVIERPSSRPRDP